MNYRTGLVLLLSVCLTASLAGAAETTVQNDGLLAGGTGSIQAGFVAGESAAAWLTVWMHFYERKAPHAHFTLLNNALGVNAISTLVVGTDP